MDFTSINTPKFNGQAKKNIFWKTYLGAFRKGLLEYSFLRDQQFHRISTSNQRNCYQFYHRCLQMGSKLLHWKLIKCCMQAFTWKVFVEQVSWRPDSQNIQINKINDTYQQGIWVYFSRFIKKYFSNLLMNKIP